MQEHIFLADVKSQEVKDAMETMKGLRCIPVYDIFNIQNPNDDHPNIIVDIQAAIPKELIKEEYHNNLELEHLLIVGIPQQMLKEKQKGYELKLANESSFTYMPFEVQND